MSLQLELEGYHSSRTNMNCGLIDKDHCKFLLARSHILGKGVCVIHTGKFPIHNHLFCFWSPCNSTLRWQSGLGVPTKSATHLLLVWSINKIVSPFWSTLSLIDPFLTILGPKTPFLVFFLGNLSMVMHH